MTLSESDSNQIQDLYLLLCPSGRNWNKNQLNGLKGSDDSKTTIYDSYRYSLLNDSYPFIKRKDTKSCAFEKCDMIKGLIWNEILNDSPKCLQLGVRNLGLDPATKFYRYLENPTWYGKVKCLMTNFRIYFRFYFRFFFRSQFWSTSGNHRFYAYTQIFKYREFLNVEISIWKFYK